MIIRSLNQQTFIKITRNITCDFSISLLIDVIHEHTFISWKTGSFVIFSSYTCDLHGLNVYTSEVVFSPQATICSPLKPPALHHGTMKRYCNALHESLMEPFIICDVFSHQIVKPCYQFTLKLPENTLTAWICALCDPRSRDGGMRQIHETTCMHRCNCQNPPNSFLSFVFSLLSSRVRTTVCVWYAIVDCVQALCVWVWIPVCVPFGLQKVVQVCRDPPLRGNVIRMFAWHLIVALPVPTTAL